MLKVKKMRKIVECELYLVTEQLKSNPDLDVLIAQKIVLESILYKFDNIKKIYIKGY